MAAFLTSLSKDDDMSLCLFALRASSEPYTSNDSGRLVHQLESPSLQTQAASKWKLSLVTVPSAYVLSHFSHVWLFVTLWTIAHQAPPSLGFSRQEYWSGLPFPSPGDLLDLQIQPKTFTSPELAGCFFITQFPVNNHFHWPAEYPRH